MAQPLPSTFLASMTLAEFKQPELFRAKHVEVLAACAGYHNIVTVFRSGCPGLEPEYEVWGDR